MILGAVGEWIPADRPPNKEDEVLVVTRSKNGYRGIDKGYYSDGRWMHRGSARVTHWMPLPMLPDEDADDIEKHLSFLLPVTPEGSE